MTETTMQPPHEPPTVAVAGGFDDGMNYSAYTTSGSEDASFTFVDAEPLDEPTWADIAFETWAALYTVLTEKFCWITLAVWIAFLLVLNAK